MKLLSNDIASGREMPSTFTCDGKNVSPELHWEAIPKEAKSLALVVSDPDAPGGNFDHWLVCNIPASASGIPQGGPLPSGSKEIANDFGKAAYGGPCPPSGTHRYFFRLYALGIEKIQCRNASELKQEISKHKVAETELMALYKRK